MSVLESVWELNFISYLRSEFEEVQFNASPEEFTSKKITTKILQQIEVRSQNTSYIDRHVNPWWLVSVRLQGFVLNVFSLFPRSLSLWPAALCPSGASSSPPSVLSLFPSRPDSSTSPAQRSEHPGEHPERLLTKLTIRFRNKAVDTLDWEIYKCKKN